MLPLIHGRCVVILSHIPFLIFLSNASNAQGASKRTRKRPVECL